MCLLIFFFLVGKPYHIYNTIQTRGFLDVLKAHLGGIVEND